MASEDVIELGSSDEESDPAPKKAKAGKRVPNAMVQIPPNITIKPAKSNKLVNHSSNPIRKLIGKELTVTKVHKLDQTSNIRNGKQPSKPLRTQKVLNPKSVQRPNIPIIATSLVNPLNMMKSNQPMVRFPKSTFTNLPIKVHGAKHVNSLPSSKKLPSGITITKKLGAVMPGIITLGIPSTSRGTKRTTATVLSNVKKKQKVTPEHHMQTVNLDDDDEPTTSNASPQWYLRPEDTAVTDVTVEENNEQETPSMEKENNSEPKKYIEITIEDSPIKPLNKRTHEIGSELAITIDDSPVKVVADKATISANSDNEDSEQSPKEKQSKKKLDYPKEHEPTQNIVSTTIEIELEPIDQPMYSEPEIEKNVVSEKSNEENKSAEAEKVNEFVHIDNIIEIIESPAKTVQTPPSTPKKVDSQSRRIEPIFLKSATPEPWEFHPVYQEFIDLCLKLENSNDMKTIVEKKIKNYYRQVPKEYTDSEEFVELVQSKLLSMKAGPEKLYLYIKDIVDELNLQRKMAKAKPTVKETRELEAEKFQYGEDSEFDQKKQRQIRKLEKTLKKLHRAIQKLEEQEVDFDDEEDSVYLLTERYKERMVRVHKKFCQLTNTKMPSEPRIQLQVRPGQPSGPAKRLEKWVNKKVPIGTPLPFPDFHDVLKCVRDANDEDKLGWNEADIMEEARDLFTRCGKKLQRRRQENEWRLAASRISAEADPAENSDELKNKLDSNKKMAAVKETEVFNKYADKQSQLNLEAIEISDKEAEESPVESEDEEPHEEKSTLENKEKRKERLRRLINEKSKKNGDKDKESKDIEIKNKLASENKEKPEGKIAQQSASQNEKKAASKKEKESNAVEATMEVDIVPEQVNKNEDMEFDSVSKKLRESNTTNKKSAEEVHSISGDSKIDSDVDELHLLQKLHSDKVNTSTANSTDSDSPVDISDSLTSSDNKKPAGSDVISIENSSYSDTESKDAFVNVNKKEKEAANEKTEVVISQRLSGEIECSSSSIQVNKTNNDEYNESVESILLATTDEEVDDKEKDESPKSNDVCVNLKDDAISIGETIVENDSENKTDDKPKCSSLKEVIKPNDNNIESKVIESNAKEKSTKIKSIFLEKNAGNNENTIEEIHSIESVESDKSQEQFKDITDTLSKVKDRNVCEKITIEKNRSDQSQKVDKHEIVSTDKQQSDIHSVEILGSDNSQEAAKDNEEAQVNNTDIINTQSVETLKPDNSQEAGKNSRDIIMENEKQSKLEIPFAEALESSVSQELATRENEDSSDLKAKDNLHSDDSPNSISKKENLEVHEVTDSNSPDQAQSRLDGESKDVEGNKCELVDSGCPDNLNSNSYDFILDDLRSEIDLQEDFASTATVKE